MNRDWAHPGQTLIWAVWVLAATTEGLAADAPLRNTQLGWVRGKQVTVLGSPKPVNVFLGIPFAAPPLGPLRFAAPQPALPWKDFRDATSFPNLCFQNLEWLVSNQHMLKVRYPEFGASEDCLYLNIYAPAQADRGSRLPVMVWLPGGAFETGSASIFDGSALAAYEDVLVVTVQYRLGIFGFFSTGDQHAPGNWAFLDQLAALSWVRGNIEFFGGDPDSVTIFGESAGAISVSSLVLSPMANGLFHKAIMESGVAIIPCLKATGIQKDKDLQALAYICGCKKVDSEALLQCLRAKSSDELLSLSQKTKSFSQVVDGQFFPNDPLDLLAQKAFNPIPSIIGVNNHECGYLLTLKEIPEVLKGSNKSLALLLLRTVLRIPSEDLHLVADEYFNNKESLVEIRDSFLDLLGDVFFVVPGLVTAQCHREGATEEEKLLSRKMMKYWANFARSGDPNGKGLPLWPAYNQNEQYLQLDIDVKVKERLKEQRVEFWTNTVPLILSSSEALRGPLPALIFLFLILPLFLSFAP
ncbi:carboxylesterase 5A isoform X2 [Choloepus didactylus]|uniref:carboxylesterase 5A isoform X2 n=1 Tax=Choloepus didactylus TaxID=27675 RepID=UPI00189DDFA0|nr:carboxylesterase 5A isoform X2 [Choloepus didactylus]